jgi:hypothetical protein
MKQCTVLCRAVSPCVACCTMVRHLHITVVFLMLAGLNRSASGSPVAGPDCTGASSSVGQWLAGLGLADYESLFHNNGFDDVDFIVSSCMERLVSGDTHRPSEPRCSEAFVASPMSAACLAQTTNKLLGPWSASELYRLSDPHLSTKFSINFCG